MNDRLPSVRLGLLVFKLKPGLFHPLKLIEPDIALSIHAFNFGYPGDQLRP